MSLLGRIEDSECSRAIESVSSTASDLGHSIWLAGGAVRDLLLDRGTTDLDFAVSSAPEQIASSLAAKLGGDVTTHPRFMTASLRTGNLVLDFAATRTEDYPWPGSLPVVQPATIEKDLGRRDFTINAMAIDLAKPDEIIDLHGALKDLDNRVIRILHLRSFFDDPTRIDRAARFATRLGFSLEAATAAELERSICEGARERVSVDRLFRELMLVFDEERAGSTLQMLASLGGLRRFKIGHLSDEQAAAIDQILSLEADFDRITAALGILFSHVSDEPVGAELPLPETKIDRIRSIAAAIAAERRPSRDLTVPELELVLRSMNPTDASDLVDYVQALTRHQRLRLPFPGGQIHPEAGPHLSRAIRETKRALAWQELSQSEAKAFAERLALRYFNDR